MESDTVPVDLQSMKEEDFERLVRMTHHIRNFHTIERERFVSILWAFYPDQFYNYLLRLKGRKNISNYIMISDAITIITKIYLTGKISYRKDIFYPKEVLSLDVAELREKILKMPKRIVLCNIERLKEIGTMLFDEINEFCQADFATFRTTYNLVEYNIICWYIWCTIRIAEHTSNIPTYYRKLIAMRETAVERGYTKLVEPVDLYFNSESRRRKFNNLSSFIAWLDHYYSELDTAEINEFEKQVVKAKPLHYCHGFLVSIGGIQDLIRVELMVMHNQSVADGVGDYLILEHFALKWDFLTDFEQCNHLPNYLEKSSNEQKEAMFRSLAKQTIRYLHSILNEYGFSPKIVFLTQEIFDFHKHGILEKSGLEGKRRMTFLKILRDYLKQHFTDAGFDVKKLDNLIALSEEPPSEYS
ncbi:MAG: hypothetical protein ACXAD7_16925 [Candidatus Kariarchaeaceae archaeon]|jgi:hypothetical protein